VLGGRSCLRRFYFAKVNSPLLDHLYLSDPYFHVGDFSFALRESVEHDVNPDYYVYQITVGEEPYTCLLGYVDTVTVPCGFTSSINFTEFLWDNTVFFLSKRTGLCAFHSIHLGSSTCVIMGLNARAGHSPPYACGVPNTINLKPPLFYPRAWPPARASAMCVSGNPLPSEV